MRLIDADALWKDITTHIDECADILEIIDRQPTVEPMRKKGEWQITEAYPHNIYCSVCHKKFAQEHWEVWKDGSLPRNFCPNCGADMRGEEG